MTVTKDQLLTLITVDEMKVLDELFGDEYNMIKLRRTVGKNQIIPFHTDFSLKTMQVRLQTGVGGQLTVVTYDGMLKTESNITIHDGRMVHGVTSLESGVRISLFLCMIPEDDLIDLVYDYFKFSEECEIPSQEDVHAYCDGEYNDMIRRYCTISPVLFRKNVREEEHILECIQQHVNFFEKMPVIPNKSTIMEWIARYREFISSGSRNEASVEVDIVWHAHMMSPDKYYHDCIDLTGKFINHVF
jgi:hypothetical protein